VPRRRAGSLHPMAEQEDDETTGDETGSEPITPKAAPRDTWLTRLEARLAPTPAPELSPGKRAKRSIDRLDGREILYGYVAGVAAAVMAVLVYVIESNDKHLKLAKNQFTPTTTLLVGLACGVLLIVTTRIGRRALVGFVAMFTFLGFQSTLLVLSLPFLVLAIWLLYRSYKVQKEATAKLRADRAAGVDTASSRSARTPKAAAASGRGAAEARSARKKGPSGPEANKRYTPKKPTPPPPPPPKQSWRERRATRASD
jgi:hypothetical protein